MSKFHLLYWMFRWLQARHPAVLQEMLQSDDLGNPGNQWVKDALQERHATWVLLAE